MQNANCILQFFLYLLIFWTSPVPAQESSAPLFDLHPADGVVATGSLQQLRDDWSVSLGGTKPIQVKGTDLISLRRSQTALPSTPRGERVVFTNGDQLPGTPLELRAERIRFQAQIGTDAELNLPLSAISLFWFPAPQGIDDGDRLHPRSAAQRRKGDCALLRNGDLVEGTLTALDAGEIHLDTAKGKEVQIARSKVAVLALSTELARIFRPKGVYGRLVLTNGARLSLLSAQANGEELIGKTFFGASVRIPVRQIIALDLRQGRAVYLSDLEPRRYEHTPYLGVHWPYTKDTSVAGNELRVGSSTFDKGIGMHSQSRLTYDLGGRYQWFEGSVGLDDRTGHEGSVLIEILVDGKPADWGTARELTGRDKPLPVRVRVAGARELTLAVLFGRHGDVQDHVDWADARLIK
ncbi:MAG TPA: NPCBM/NEW2 domain-containing protein [Gemmataceae bacterium]|nr:NPCBM/NEW2 domain-containing protein [Gemmataceae bacterium]